MSYVPDPDETLAGDPPDDAEGRPRPRRKGIYILPNLFTLAALFGGFYAIVLLEFQSNQSYTHFSSRPLILHLKSS